MRELIYDTCLDYGVDDTLQMAYVLTTAYIESEGLTDFTEDYNGDPYAYFEGKYGHLTRVGKILGNTQEGDGAKFRGRGFVQITGRYNYTKFSKILGLDLIDDPSLASIPEHAVKILVLGMRDGLFTGKKLSDYLVTMEKCDLENARKIVNPGESTRRLREFEDRFEKEVKWIGSHE